MSKTEITPTEIVLSEGDWIYEIIHPKKGRPQISVKIPTQYGVKTLTIGIISEDECLSPDCCRREDHSIAGLIAEAGTVYHETKLTPRQLLEQRNELLQGLKLCKKELEMAYSDKLTAPKISCLTPVNLLIKKVTGE